MCNKQISPNDVDAILEQLHGHYKNPTTSIINELSQVAYRLAQDERYDDVKGINSVIKKCYSMLRTASNVDTYYKLIAPVSPLKPEKTVLNLYLKDLFNTIKVAFTDSEFSFEYSICKEQIITELDTNYLATAIFQLISNSCTFSPRESLVRVALKTNNQNINIIVTDEGDGIPTSDFEKVFTPFYTHSYLAQPDKDVGVGLGLPIVKQIATLMGGTVLVGAGQLGGTVVTISFPIVNTNNSFLTLKSSTTKYVTNRFSPMHLHLSNICNFQYN